MFFDYQTNIVSGKASLKKLFICLLSARPQREQQTPVE